jgi:nicotine blue oxidoreductase
VATVVLAAGAGRRFGGAKQLAPVEGRPMLARVLDALDGAGEPQVVVLGARAETVRKAVPDHWRIAVAADWEAGLGASLRAGLGAVPEMNSALIVLGDLPWLRRQAIRRVLEAASGVAVDADVVRAYDGITPGHPVLLRGPVLDRARLAPDAGLRQLLSEVPVAPVDCTGLGVARDVDAPLDLDG